MWGHLLWNAARCLAALFDSHPAICSGRAILELGAGAGLPSIVAALNGAAVVAATDYPDPPLIAALRSNLAANLPTAPAPAASAPAAAGACHAFAAGYRWGDDPAPLLAD